MARDVVTARDVGWGFKDIGRTLRHASGACEKRFIFPPGWFSKFPWPFMSLMARSANRWLAAAKPPNRVVVLSYPQYVVMLDRLPGVRSVYYWSDDFFTYWPSREQKVRDLEARIVSSTSLTITASLSKRDELRMRFPELAGRIHAVIHGPHPAIRAKAAGIAPAPLPDELKHLKRPILGHWGNISNHLDLWLAVATAKAFPLASIVFVGPVVGGELPARQQEALAELRALSNVHFIPRKPYGDIGEYVPAFDVCLCLYRPDIYFCQVINPSKVRDYLASGRPIVSTPIPEVCKLWASFVHVATGPDEYVSAVRAALDDRNFQARLAYSDDNSYEKVSQRIFALLTGQAVDVVHPHDLRAVGHSENVVRVAS